MADFDLERSQTRKYIIGSAISAQREADQWLRENNAKKVVDGDGLVWNLDIRVTELPSETETRGGSWQVNCQLNVDATAADLIKTGTLHESKDARLIELLGKEIVPILLKPMVLKCKSVEEVVVRLAEMMPDLRHRMLSQPLRDIKRSLVGLRINQMTQFADRKSAI